jgi:uncharacterized protein YifN (PemK superfamily)
VSKGQSFLSEPEKAKSGTYRHLNIVISNADTENYFLVVPVTTWREKNGVPFDRQDASCILPENCHSFLKHKSWVDFSRAKKMSYIEIFNGLQKGLLIRKEDMPPEQIQKIQNAAKVSRVLLEKFQPFFDYF